MAQSPTNPAISTQNKPKVVIVTGPTAVGKTAVSLSLAERLNGEIISADSVQVYKNLDIGSDKIPVAERRGIPHHLLDVFEPEQDFSAGEFYNQARAITQDILSRGKTPILVGGTGFYLRWYLLGKPSTPTASKESEAVAEQRLNDAYKAAEAALGRELTPAERWAAGVDVVAQLGDLESAERLKTESNNYYRLHRIVDILLQAPGRTLADLKSDEAAELDYDFRCFYLTRPRVELYRRIDSRVEDMAMNGLITETYEELVATRGLAANSNCATRAIGYRQTLDFLEKARQNGPDWVTESTIIELVKFIQSASRQLCNRQMNWFRDDALFRWIDGANSGGQAAIVEEIIKLWEEPSHQGGGWEELGGGRLNKEQQQEMKRYVAKIEKLVKKSPEMQKVIEEARGIVVKMGENKGEEEPDAKRIKN